MPDRDVGPRPVPLRPLARRARPARPAVRRAGGARRGRRATCSPAASLRDALRDLLRRGLDGRGGLDDLADAGPPDARRRPGGAATSAAPSTRSGPRSTRRWPQERDDPRRPATATTPGWPRWSSTTLPDDAAGAVRALADYDWRSRRGPGDLRVDPADAAARGARRAVRRAEAGARRPRTPRRCRRSRTCWPTSTRCWPRTPAARTPTDQFAEFMDKHGDLFPEQPENVDELIDALARRQAAAERMMALAVPEQREQLGQLMSEALAGRRPGLADGAARRTTCARCGPGWTASPVEHAPGRRAARLQRRGRGGGRARRPRGAASSQLAQGVRRLDPGRRRRRDGWSSTSAPARPRDFEALRELERELERQGYVTRGDDGLRLTPRAVRRLGETRAASGSSRSSTPPARGDHDDHRTGSADELTGLTRPWVFGDELPHRRRPDRRRTPLRRRGLGVGRVRLAGRGLRGGRDRAADDGRGRALRRPVVLDGAARAAGAR